MNRIKFRIKFQKLFIIVFCIPELGVLCYTKHKKVYSTSFQKLAKRSGINLFYVFVLCCQLNVGKLSKAGQKKPHKFVFFLLTWSNFNRIKFQKLFKIIFWFESFVFYATQSIKSLLDKLSKAGKKKWHKFVFFTNVNRIKFRIKFQKLFKMCVLCYTRHKKVYSMSF